MAALGISAPQLQGVRGLPALSFGSRKAAAVASVSCELRSCQKPSSRGGGWSLSLQLGRNHIRERDSRLIQQQRHGFPIRFRRTKLKPLAVTGATTGGGGETGAAPDDEKRAKKTREEMDRRASDFRSKVINFFEQKSDYQWLLGPAAITAAILIPATAVNLASLFQRNFLAGLAATFGQDILFVLATDLFLVLADKLGHHKKVDGGSPPWIGPWEYTGYPEGYPKLLNYISYSSVGLGILAIFLSAVLGKLPAGLATFGPYLGLLFAQVAYERLLSNDKLPVSPLVPIVYTVYRFRQLTRGLALLPFITNGGGVLPGFINLSSILWALYLSMYLTQLPWLYSTWNSNRAT